ncbi:MAG: HDOD domain-containing protein [Gammaproteobacteria bacterium]|nr:HDOD domain-containing protein [Gammaproteobacteria bacterium]
MTESINSWVARLSSEPLPIMRRTLTRVKDLLQASSTSHRSLREVIEFDPGFTLHIFRLLRGLANQPKEPVNKLSNALPLLGMQPIEQAVHTLPALEDRLKGPPRRNLYDCYSRAAHASIYTTELSRRLGFRDQDALASAAILQDIGEMALWNAAPEVMQQIHRLMLKGDGREDAALQVLGFSLDILNQQLGKRWQLPELVQASHEIHNSFQPQPLTVMLACAVARDSTQSWTSNETLVHLELLAEFLEISLEQAQAQLHQTSAVAARKLHGLPLPLPAFRLAYAIETSSRRIKQAAKTDAKAEPRPAPSVKKIERTAQPATPPKTAVASKPAPSSNPLHESLTRTVDAMQAQHGLQNVMFAMLSSDKSKLTARFVSGDQAQTRLKGFQVNLQQPSLFSLLMKKPQAIWLNAGNLEKYQRMIPQALLQRLNADGFLVMSIFIKNKPVGLFYADNRSVTPGPLTGEQYTNFKALCHRFTKELG